MKCPYCGFKVRHFGIKKDGTRVEICNHCKMEFKAEEAE